jgi:ariadne-1
MDATTALPCGHRFCNGCWGLYVSLKIKEGQARRITCMGHKCNLIFDENLIADLVEPRVYERYVSNLVDSYIEDNPHSKW